ncbi:hypothetical protein Nepgr_011172 [Nepenthes gracilis]|uniref:Cytochrome b561 and DOMON domain-containing protein n=1 Tax=Nepenthes gracilis TaxID=150966 RepID=A0AAD3XM51_NEPGR|nr:hypothetical protein Nepgr_011172 [Nepenthes gracilis]
MVAQAQELQKNLPSPYDKVPWPNAPQITWNSFSLKYTRRDNIVNVLMSGPYKKGWLAIGLSKSGRMIGASAVVAWAGRDGKGVIKQYLLNGYSPSQVTPNKGDLPLTKAAPVALLDQGTLYMAFQLELSGGNMTQKVILASAPDTPAAENLLFKHTARTLIQMDFSAGSAIDYGKQKAIHGAVGMIAWLVLLPWGILIPRYLKHHDPLWFYLHLSVQVLGYLFAVSTGLSGLKLESDMHVNVTPHKQLGMLIVLLATLQVCAICARPGKQSSKRKYWNCYHRCVGILAICLGIINAGFGIRRAEAGMAWTTAHILLTGCFVLAVVVLEVLSKSNGASRALEAPVFDVDNR